MDFFRETTFRPLGGAAPSIFFTCTRDSPRLASAYPSGAGVPPKSFNRENLKFALKFSLLESITSGLVGLSSRNFSVYVPRDRGDKMGANFERPAPKNLRGQKIVQNFSRFLTTFDFDREYLRSGSTYQKSEKLLKIYNRSHVGGKKVYVLQSTNDRVYSPNKFTP